MLLKSFKRLLDFPTLEDRLRFQLNLITFHPNVDGKWRKIRLRAMISIATIIFLLNIHGINAVFKSGGCNIRRAFRCSF